MTRQRMWIAAAAAAVVGLGFASVQANRLLKGTPTAVAIVEVQRVIDSLKEKVAIEAQMQQHNEQVQKEKTDRERAVKQMQDELQLLTPGTENHRKKLEAAERAVIELNAWLQFENNKLVRERGTQIEALYQKMLKATADVAKSNGYQIVLFGEGPADFRAENPQQLSTLIQIRKVIWYDPALDITDMVTQKMNNDFQNR